MSLALGRHQVLQITSVLQPRVSLAVQSEKVAKQVILGTVYELQFFLTVKAIALSPGRNFEMLLSLAEDKIMETGYLGD